MEFCPKCGSVIIIKNCARCDYTSEVEVKIESTQIGPSHEINIKEIAIVSEGENEVFPIIEAICQKCKNQEAYFWTKQTRSADEAETKFFRCTKCKHTWREYR
jgi:DNA-directed RNA polymerase subunit M